LAEPGGLEVEAEVRVGTLELDVAFEVEPGEILVLVGPSGAGKSSSLEIVAGLLCPARGRVAVAGASWLDTERGIDWPPERRRAGLVFQDYALFPHLDVLGNVAYGSSARGCSRASARTRAASWLERLGIGALGARSTATLSGGERQRVAVARALAAEPSVLLLDEPFGSLDASTRSSVRGELRAFLREVSLPTVLVTHDPVDALALGDRIAVIDRGRIAQIGRREDLLEHPRSPIVAELAGLNLYRADLAPGRGLKEARTGRLVFHVLADDRTGPSFVAFAPSDVVLSAAPAEGSAQNVFAGEVRELLPLPDRVRVVVDAGELIAADLTREAAARLGVAPRQRLWASIKATGIRIYG
jgi:molybdate transport system ATP-binding protein